MVPPSRNKVRGQIKQGGGPDSALGPRVCHLCYKTFRGQLAKVWFELLTGQYYCINVKFPGDGISYGFGYDCVVECLCSYKIPADGFKLKCPDVHNLVSSKREREKWSGEGRKERRIEREGE